MPRTRADGSTRETGESREAELRDTAEWLASYGEAMADDLHPDRIGVRRAPEPKSLFTEVRGRTGSIAKRKTGSGKVSEPQPYSYSRHGLGRWRQRG